MDMSLYEEIIVNGKKYVLIHAGFENFSEEKPLADYSLEDLDAALVESWGQFV